MKRLDGMLLLQVFPVQSFRRKPSCFGVKKLTGSATFSSCRLS